MAKTSYHMCMSVQGALRNRTYRLRGALMHDDGREMSEIEAFDALCDELVQGHAVMKVSDCDNFDYQNGCLGHPVHDDDDDGENPGTTGLQLGPEPSPGSPGCGRIDRQIDPSPSSPECPESTTGKPMNDIRLLAVAQLGEPDSVPYASGPIWNRFELSYSSYLVLPRRALCSMPLWWQASFVQLIDLAKVLLPSEAIDCEYWVRRREGGRFVNDPNVPYRHAAPWPLKTLGERK